jgi:hypothetical protein
MSFRNQLNRHDEWEAYRQANAAAFAELGVPDADLTSEQALAAFLTTGRSAAGGVTLDGLPDDAFWRLFKLATSRFDEHAAGFTATEARRLGGRRIVPADS